MFSDAIYRKQVNFSKIILFCISILEAILFTDVKIDHKNQHKIRHVIQKREISRAEQNQHFLTTQAKKGKLYFLERRSRYKCMCTDSTILYRYVVFTDKKKSENYKYFQEK